MEQKGFEKPNHTQTPNSFFDESLRTITSLPELKVVLAVIRKTHGWQKTQDKISMSQLEQLTGLKHQSVQRGIELALRDGFIEREASGQSFFYSLKLVTPCDQSHHVTSHTTLLEPVTPRDGKRVKPVTPRDTQKKEEKEKKETSSAYADLFSFHAGFLDGPIPDPSVQGKAINGLLENYTVEECKSYYSHLRGEEWRTTPVTWLTVKRGIGDWLARGRTKQNDHKPKVEVDPFGEPWVPKPFTWEDAAARCPDKNPDDIRLHFEDKLAWEDVRCR
jgi:phage replication O-like protein O